MPDGRISRLFAWEALDSRGRPTVACALTLESGVEVVAMVPSGASTGTHEALELRDGDARYSGLGVLKAVGNVNGPLRAAVLGMDCRDQEAVDSTLLRLNREVPAPGLGSNAMLAVSLAAMHAAAATAGVPLFQYLSAVRPLLPMPMINVVSGGAHAAGILDVQDFLVIPVGAGSFAQAIEWAARVRHAASKLVAERGGAPGLVADEGGLAVALDDNATAISLLTDAIQAAGLRPGPDVGIAIDVAATQLYSDGTYNLASEGRHLSSAEMVEMIADWCARWPVVSLEDPLAEDDWDGWEVASRTLKDVQLIGDDLFVTNLDRLAEGVRRRVANTVLAKINQNGTISGTSAVVELARRSDYSVVVSARSGETEDSSIADLAVGWRAGQIKVGSLTRSERNAKWNRLLRIEAELGAAADFAGREAFARRSP